MSNQHNHLDAPHTLSPGTEWAVMHQAVAGMMNDALSTFYLSVDKELAAAASYKALGLDPRDAPRFGWGLMKGKPPMSETNVTQLAVPQTAPVAEPGKPAGLPTWAKASLGSAAIVASLLAGSQLGKLSPQQEAVNKSAPATAKSGHEAQLEYRAKDGTWKPLGPAVSIP